MFDTGVVLEDARDECDGQNNYETTESGLMRCGLQLDGANIMNQTNSYSDQREQVNLS